MTNSNHSAEQPSLLRELIDIPTTVQSADFVLTLQQGLSAAEQTLQDYVVTENIADSFAQAFDYLDKTFSQSKNHGTFVHGSFGSGKSHFMAVLDLMLNRNSSALALPNLQQVVADNEAVLNKNLLTLDFHLIGAESIESALFGGYLRQIMEKHPDAPTPVLHRSEALFADAQNQREVLGDEAFFGALNKSSGAGGWGKLAAAWDAGSFDSALRSPSGSDERQRLVTALTSTLFRSYTAAGQWLDMESGLRALTAHAAGLGYDGVVLFLDELVLWLAQHLADVNFIQSEGSKVAKLVESEITDLPVFSFIARQRDLQDFLGDTAAITGAHRAAVGETFKWWEGRFDRIDLDAADLPQIVNKRLLQPRNDEAAQELERSVQQVKTNHAAWRHLLTDAAGSDEIDFGLVYPFSPALIDSLIGLSALMQRERTALRIMAEMLSNGRDELTAIDVIPVGDLFDFIIGPTLTRWKVNTQPPLTPEMQLRFDVARNFYDERFTPYLLRKHALTLQEARGLDRSHAFWVDDRLIKTLLVTFLVPQVAALRDLTAEKLSALNYGSIRSFIPGSESSVVLGKVQEWSNEFAEIHVGHGENPVITMQLTGVDYESVLQKVEMQDTTGARRDLIRDLLVEAFELQTGIGMLPRTRSVVWRGTKRQVESIFGEVRDRDDLPDEAFRSSGTNWKIIIDFPFGEAGISRRDATSRIADLLNSGFETHTLVWIPNFLSTERLRDLGRLVQLEWVLRGEQFDRNAAHLPVDDRLPARNVLENQRETLRQNMIKVLHQAYGVSEAKDADIAVDLDLGQVFTSLDRTVTIDPPIAATLDDALDDVIQQALTGQYPKHPEFSGADEIRRTDLKHLCQAVSEAVDSGGRVEGIDRSRARTFTRITRGLGAGEVRETVLHISTANFSWYQDFTRWTSETQDAGTAVAQLRDNLASYGMSSDLEDTLIIIWALLADQEWVRANTKIPTPDVGALRNDMVLRRPRLPSEEEWEVANERAAIIFGVRPEQNRSVTAQSRIATALKNSVQASIEPASRLVQALEVRADLLALQDGARRLETARLSDVLLKKLRAETDHTTLLQVLAAANLPSEPHALARSISTATKITTALETMQESVIGFLQVDPTEGAEIISELRRTAASDELHAPLAEALKAAQDTGLQIMNRRATAPQKTTPTAPPASPVPAEPQTPVDARIDSPEATADSAPVSPQSPVEAATLDALNAIELEVTTDEKSVREVVEQIREAAAKNPGRKLRVKWWFE